MTEITATIGTGPRSNIVLLIRIDGMHAVDYLNCKNGIASLNSGAPYYADLAELGTIGLNYTSGSATKPSDSFPGLMGIVSGPPARTILLSKLFLSLLSKEA